MWINEEQRQDDVVELAKVAPSGQAIYDECMAITKLLLKKNIAYGNSALEPSNIFAKATAKEQIAVRIDDKLNRLKKGSEFEDEDTILDLIGYLILYRIAHG